jgi:hypothetical protein
VKSETKIMPYNGRSCYLPLNHGNMMAEEVAVALKNKGSRDDFEEIIARIFNSGLADALNTDLEITAGQTRR